VYSGIEGDPLTITIIKDEQQENATCEGLLT